MPGVYVSSQRDYLERIVSQEDDQFRVFTGYAGWGAGQLESEMWFPDDQMSADEVAADEFDWVAGSLFEDD